MKTFMRLLLLTLILSLGISGTGIQKIQAQSKTKLPTGKFMGQFHVIIYSIDYEHITGGPLSHTNNYVYSLDLEGKIFILVDKDYPYEPDTVMTPGYTTFYQFHIFNVNTPTGNCSTMGYMDGEAKIASDVSNFYWAIESYFSPKLNISKVKPQQFTNRVSGSSKQCGFPVSRETLDLYVQNITAKINQKGFLYLNIYSLSDTYLGGGISIPGWDLKQENEFGYVEQKVSGTWWARKVDLTGKWRNGVGK